MSLRVPHLPFAPHLPPPPFEGDAERWALFCETVELRIEVIRDEEEHDAEWCVFERPLPEQVEALSLPIGKVCPGPPSPPRRG